MEEVLPAPLEELNKFLDSNEVKNLLPANPGARYIYDGTVAFKNFNGTKYKIIFSGHTFARIPGYTIKYRRAVGNYIHEHRLHKLYFAIHQLGKDYFLQEEVVIKNDDESIGTIYNNPFRIPSSEFREFIENIKKVKVYKDYQFRYVTFGSKGVYKLTLYTPGGKVSTNNEAIAISNNMYKKQEGKFPYKYIYKELPTETATILVLGGSDFVSPNENPTIYYYKSDELMRYIIDNASYIDYKFADIPLSSIPYFLKNYNGETKVEATSTLGLFDTLNRINPKYNYEKNEYFWGVTTYVVFSSSIIPYLEGKGIDDEKVPEKEIEDFNLDQYKIGFGITEFKNFEDPDLDANCVVSCLLKFYSGDRVGRKTKSIFSREKILDYFSEGAPTWGSLIKFFTKFNLSCTIYSCMRTVAYEYTGNNKIARIRLLLTPGHVSLGKEALANKTGVNVFELKNKTKSIFSECPKQLINVATSPGISIGDYPISNFTYKAYSKLIPLSVEYYDHSYADGMEITSIDMNKAYRTATFRVHPETLIGIFTCTDFWQAYDGSMIQEECKYYFDSADLRQFIPYQVSPVVLGFRCIGWPIKPRYMIIPTYTVTFGEYQDKYRLCLEEEERDKKYFSALNGLQGRNKKRDKKTYFSFEKREDALAFKKIHPEMKVTRKDGIYYAVYIHEIGEYLYINNRNFYDATIEATNLYMDITIDRIKKEHPSYKIIKIKVDSITVVDENDKPVVLNYEDFKIEKKKLRKRNVSCRDVDMIRIATEVQEELDLVKKRLIIGMPGSGKTKMVKDSKEYDYAAAANNSQASNIDGTTLHRLLLFRDKKSLRGKRIWIDEVFMVNEYLWGHIIDASINFEAEFIFTGDPNQLNAPFSDHEKIKPFYSWLFKNYTLINQQHRYNSSNRELMNDPIALKNHIVSNTRVWNATKLPLVNITVSNNMANDINKFIEKQEDKSFHDITPGVRIVSVSRITRHAIMKNSIFEVVEDRCNDIVIKRLYPSSKRNIVITFNEYMSYFRLGYAMNCYLFQGHTISEPIAIHEVFRLSSDTIAFSKYIYTALTRSTDPKQVELYSKPYDDEIELKLDYNYDVPNNEDMVFFRCDNDYYLVDLLV